MTVHLEPHTIVDELVDAVRTVLKDACESEQMRTAIAALPNRTLLDRLGTGLWEQLAGLGCLAAFTDPDIPAESRAALVVDMCHEIGYWAAPVPFVTNAIAAMAVLREARSTEVVDAAIDGIGAGRDTVAVVLTNSIVESIADPAVTSTASPEGRHLDGEAGLVVDAARASFVLVEAKDPDLGEMRTYLIPASRAGVDISPTPSVDATHTLATVSFRHVGVTDADEITGGPGADAVWDLISLCVAADAVGAARRAFDLTHAYVLQREQFGRPIGSFQVMKHRLADMYMTVLAGKELISDAAGALDAGTIPARGLVAPAVAFAKTHSVSVVGLAIQSHGAIGVTWEYKLHVLLKRAALDEVRWGPPNAFYRLAAHRFEQRADHQPDAS